MKKVFSFITAIMLFNSCVQAQTIDNNEQIKELFRQRVKLVDEFMRRFNCVELLPGLDTSKSNYNELNIISLFDGTMFGTQEDSVFKAAQMLVDSALKNDIKIDYSDTSWFAVAPCHGKLKDKDVDFMLILNVEKRGEDMYKWVIAKAQGEIFKLTPSNTASGIMLMPDDHEINFMSLNRITHQTDDLIINYMQKQYELDETAVFLTYVNLGLLDIEYVSDLQFTFLQVPGWQFTIRQFERMTQNSGWLITSFSPMSDEDKQTTMENIYHKK